MKYKSALGSSTEQTKDFNAVKVEKTGGRGVISVAQEAADKNLSLGAPGEKPQGGIFLTRGGLHVTAHVDSLTFVNKNINGDMSPLGTSERAIEDLIDQLDDSKGVVLSSSYEFPGRYVLR
jgi:anthranilate synthase